MKIFEPIKLREGDVIESATLDLEKNRVRYVIRRGKKMKIYDADGAERDWEWVKEKYNLPEIDRAPKELAHWEVVELRENCRDSSMTVRALLGNGSPAGSLLVRFSWPDGYSTKYTGIFDGEAGFGMGGGAYYRPPDFGPHWATIVGRSDTIRGLGMLGKKDHWHLEPTFQFVKASPGEPPEDDYKAKYDEVLGVLGDIESLILPYVLDRG